MDRSKALFRVVLAAISAVVGLVAGFFLVDGWSEHGRVALGVTIAAGFFGAGFAIDLGVDWLRQTSFFTEDDGHTARNQLGALIGTVLGLVGGVIVVHHIGLRKTTFMLVPLGAVIGALAVGLLFHFAQNMHEATDDRSGRRVRKATVAGAVLGLLLTAYVIAATALTWPFAFVGAGIGAAAVGGLWQASSNGYSKSKPSKAQWNIHPADGMNFTSQRNLDAARKFLQPREGIKSINGLHWVGLLVALRPQIVLSGLILWTAYDFVGRDKIVQGFREHPRWLFFLLAFVIYGVYWLVKYRKVLRKRFYKVIVTTVIIILVWAGLNTPLGSFIRTAFQDGHPLPWLVANIPILIWAAWRWLLWRCFFMMNTGARLVKAWALPYPFTARDYNMKVPVKSSDAISPWQGRMLGYGTAQFDDAADRDKEFAITEHLRGHREFVGSVSGEMI